DTAVSISFLLISMVNRLGCESAKVANTLTYKKIFVLELRKLKSTVAVWLCCMFYGCLSSEEAHLASCPRASIPVQTVACVMIEPDSTVVCTPCPPHLYGCTTLCSMQTSTTPSNA